MDPTTTSTQFQAVSFSLKREWWSRTLGWGVTVDLRLWPPAIFCSSSPFFGRRCPRRARSGAAQCSTRCTSFLSGPPLPYRPLVLLVRRPRRLRVFPVFSGLSPVASRCWCVALPAATRDRPFSLRSSGYTLGVLAP